MLKKLWNYILLLIYYFYHNIMSRSKVENKKPSLLDIYTETQKKRLLNTYNDNFHKNMNENIRLDIYDKFTFKEILKTPNNKLEEEWSKRLLYQCVPRSDNKQIDIIMYYDIYKQAFAYYSNENVLSYTLLNAVAMNYVITFFCRDFFMDEYILPEDEKYATKLREVFLKYDEDEKEEIKTDKNVMAKLKNYRIESTKQKEKQQNKFINMGKLHNFSFLSKNKNKKQSFLTSYDGMFEKISYKDYKQHNYLS